MNNSTFHHALDNSVYFSHLKMYLSFLICVNIISSILAASFNFLILFTFVKTSSLRTPSYILILSLAISDLGVGVVTQPAYCFGFIAWIAKNHSLFKSSTEVFEATFHVFETSSFLTVTAIAIDRFLAVNLHLRYQQLVKIKRSYIAVIGIWAVSVSWSFVLKTNIKWLSIADAILVLLTVVFDIYLMMEIARKIQRHSAQIQAQQQPQQLPTMNLQRYKKSVQTLNNIMAVFIICFLPSYIIIIVDIWHFEAAGNTSLVYAGLFANTLVMINSALNPIIYCWRIQEIRNALLQLLKRQ